jgi:hypothetical protein
MVFIWVIACSQPFSQRHHSNSSDRSYARSNLTRFEFFFFNDLLNIFRRDTGQICRSKFTKDDKTSHRVTGNEEICYRSVRTITSQVIGITSPSLYFLSSAPGFLSNTLLSPRMPQTYQPIKSLLKLRSYHWRMCLQRLIHNFAHRNYCLLFQRFPNKLNRNRSILVRDRIIYKGHISA